jgi:AraC family transcriptional regulator
MRVSTMLSVGQPGFMQDIPRTHDPYVSCSALKAARLGGSDDAELPPVTEQIEVLIPADDAVFEVRYRLNNTLIKTVVMHGPVISIVPADKAHGAYRIRRSDVLVITLDPIFYREKALDALGRQAPDITESYTGDEPFIREIGIAMRCEFRRNGLPRPEYMECCAEMIAIHLAHNFGQRHSERGRAGLQQRKLRKVLDFIREHLNEKIQVEALAQTACMSPFHFARRFKEAVGLSPHAYIVTQRMHRAEDMLRNTALPLVEVAATVGFQTQAHFTGVFHRNVGVTPRAYRLGSRVPNVR